MTKPHSKPHSYCAVPECELCYQHAEAELEQCGCCEQYHPKGYTGDCRNDRFRFPDLEAYITWKVTGERPDLSPAGQRRVKEHIPW